MFQFQACKDSSHTTLLPDPRQMEDNNIASLPSWPFCYTSSTAPKQCCPRPAPVVTLTSDAAVSGSGSPGGRDLVQGHTRLLRGTKRAGERRQPWNGGVSSGVLASLASMAFLTVHQQAWLSQWTMDNSTREALV